MTEYFLAHLYEPWNVYPIIFCVQIVKFFFKYLNLKNIQELI